MSGTQLVAVATAATGAAAQHKIAQTRRVQHVTAAGTLLIYTRLSVNISHVVSSTCTTLGPWH